MSKSKNCTKINEDNGSKMSYNGVANQPKEHRGVSCLMGNSIHHSETIYNMLKKNLQTTALANVN